MENKLKLISANDLTRRLSFQDTSGGYGADYPAPSFVILKISDPFGLGTDALVRYQNTLDPVHPEWLFDPTVVQIINGTEFPVDSYRLGVTKADQEYMSFRDGVLDVNYYVGFSNVSVVGLEGAMYVTGTALDTVLEKYDSVIVGTEIYELDKTKPTQGGTRMYLTTPLKTQVSSVTIALRQNLKLRNNFTTKCIIARMPSVLTNDSLPFSKGRYLESQNGFLKVIKNDLASRILFEQQDYKKADELLKESVRIGLFIGLIKKPSQWL